jgi:hypothetical protein
MHEVIFHPAQDPDIVSQLRRLADLNPGMPIYARAADEIEKVRNQRDKWAQCAEMYERGAMSDGDRLFVEASFA